MQLTLLKRVVCPSCKGSVLNKLMTKDGICDWCELKPYEEAAKVKYEFTAEKWSTLLPFEKKRIIRLWLEFYNKPILDSKITVEDLYQR